MKSLATSQCLAVWALLTCCGCAAPPSRDLKLEDLGYHDVNVDRTEIEDAVEVVNAILGPEVSFRFVAISHIGGGSDEVSVRPVAGQKGERLGACFTLTNPTRVAVDVELLDVLRSELSGPTGSPPDISRSSLLAILLLHEAGHIYLHHQVESESVGHGLNVDDTTRKDMEQAADRFAAQQLKAAYASAFPSARLAPAMKLAIELPKISFNLCARRVVDHFGESTLRPKEVFWDTSYTHPNTELRFLAINAEFYQSKESEDLLSQFMGQRERAKSPYHLLDP